MGLWRCQRDKCSEDRQGRCIFDFEAERPVCPKCKTDHREFPQIVIKLETIHYEAVEGKIGELSYGTKELACQPGKPIKPGTHRSSAARAVNCPECRKTALWRDGMKNQGEVLEDKDYPVEIDAEKMEHRFGNASTFAGDVDLKPETPPEIIADKLSDEGKEKEATVTRRESRKRR